MKNISKFLQLSVIPVMSLLLLLFLGSCSSKMAGGGFSGPERKPPSDESIRKILSGVRTQPGNPDSHYWLGCYHQERGEHEKAIEEFGKTVLIDPGYTKAYNAMGVSHDLLREYPQALDSYRRALQVDPSLDYVHNNLGYSFLIQGELEKAISAFQKAITMNGREERFHNNLGLAYALRGDLSLAMAEFQRGGEESRAYFNIAQFYSRLGLYSIAKLHYSFAMSLDPSFTRARLASEGAGALAEVWRGDLEKGPKTEKEKADFESLRERPLLPAPPMLKAQGFGPTNEEREGKGPSPIHSPQPLTGETQNFNERVTGLPDPGQQTSKGGPGFFPRSNSLNAPSGREATQASPVKGRGSAMNMGIEISNGNGVNGLARKVGDYLKERGLPVKRYTNADHFGHGKTKIYYQEGCREFAQQVAEELPGAQKMERKGRWDRRNIHVKVMIGKDILSTEVAKGKERTS